MSQCGSVIHLASFNVSNKTESVFTCFKGVVTLKIAMLSRVFLSANIVKSLDNSMVIIGEFLLCPLNLQDDYPLSLVSLAKKKV